MNYERSNSQKPTELKSMRLSTSVIDNVKQMAQNQNRSFSNMVDTLLKKASEE